MENIEFLEKEYDRVTFSINSYTNRQINYMNYTLILFGGAFLYLAQSDQLSNFKPYFPYFLFLVYGQFLLEIYRTIILQYYRKYIADKINSLLGEKVIITPIIYKRFIINLKSNLFYLTYTIFWILVLIAFFIFCNYDIGFDNLNSIIQFIIILTYIVIYFVKTYKATKINFDTLEG